MPLLHRPARSRPVSNAVRALPLDYELGTMKSFDQAMADLPENAHVSVICSPVKGIAATQESSVRLLELGHRPVPHLTARMVEDREHAAKLARWLREYSIDEVFVIAGDAPEPLGPYEGALTFIRDLLDGNPGVSRVGVAGYPEGHAAIDERVVADQLAATNCCGPRGSTGGCRRRCVSTRSRSVAGSFSSGSGASRSRFASACPVSSSGRNS
jgi:hypothetical protein